MSALDSSSVGPAAQAKPVSRRATWVRGQASTYIAAVMLVLTLLVIIVPPFLSIYKPYAIDLGSAKMPPFHSWHHLLGTDELGRDMLSRLALAGRVSILVAIPALIINMFVGVVLGLCAGYLGGIVNSVIMGLADVQISIPIIILLVMIVAVVGPGTVTLILVLGLTYWVGYGRVARVLALQIREREFVLASRTFGGSPLWVIRKHLLPQLGSQLAIMGSFDLGVIIILEASLSYLGLGIQAPTPSWGGMINEGQEYLQTNMWIVVLPSIAIFLLVAGVQILSQRVTGERETEAAVRTV